MRSTPVLLPAVLLSGCLLGQSPFKGADAPPGLVDDGGFALVEPLQVDGVPRVRAGTDVVVDLAATLLLRTEPADPTDPDAPYTKLTVDGAPFTFVEKLEGTEHPTYRFHRVLDGDEGSSPKSLRAELVSLGFGKVKVETSAVLFTTDFDAPSAGCILSPRNAGEGETVTLRVSPSEAMDADAVVVTPSDPRVHVGAPTASDGQFVFPITADADTNVDGYVLEVTATDRAGNAQEGDSLCSSGNPTGTILGRGPRLDPDVSFELTAGRSVDQGGLPWVRAATAEEAKAGQPTVLTVRLPTLDPLASSGSAVTLSGVPLTPMPDDPNTWTLEIDGDEGDGLKTLDARLVDPAGNELVVQRRGLLRLDLTPPTADCLLAPRDAKGSDVVLLQVFASEVLREGAPAVTADSTDLTVASLGSTGSQHRYRIDLANPVDVPAYALTILGTDRAGNAPVGGSLCDIDARSGSLLGKPPLLTAEPTVEATPSVPGTAGELLVRAGATVTVTLPTDKALATDVSTVTLGGTPLAWQGGAEWAITLDGSEGDGLKGLDAQLFDAAGNRLVVQRPGVVRFDFTAPAADCVLAPATANASDAVVLQVFTSETLAGGAPTVSVDAPELTITPLTSSGNRHTYGVTLQGQVDVDAYVLTITGQDRAGNAQEGASFCDLASRSGAFLGLPPVIDPTRVTLVVTPSVVVDGQTRARAGAVVTVTLPTDAPVDDQASTVTLSGMPLSWAGADQWTRTLDGTEGDGFKALDARLVDPVGNETRVRSADLPAAVAFVADFTPPLASSSVLSRTPFFSPAVLDGGRTVVFTDVDPYTGEVVVPSVTVLASEPVQEAVGVATVGPASVSWDVAPVDGNVIRFSRAGVSDLPEGTYSLYVVVSDAVGNVSVNADLGLDLVVDRTGPTEAPDTETLDRIVYTRQPWGTSATGGEARFQVDGEAGAAIPGATVVARSSSGTYLGSGTAQADGSFAALRTPADLANVYVSQLDEAGNPSPSSRVRDVEWVATLGSKVPGDLIANPHTLSSAPDRERGLDPDGTRELTTVPSVGNPVASGGLPIWRRAGTGEVPSPRLTPTASLDPARGELLVFGGTTQAPFEQVSELWAFNGRSWREIGPPGGGPSPRFGAAMAWDPIGQRTLLAGGATYSATYGETFAWTGTRWEDVGSAEPRPGLRSFSSMATQVTSARVILFGGKDQDGTLLGDTWAWSGTAWSQVQGPGPKPAPRFGAPMVWDPVREELVLFGGATSASGVLGDTWLFGDTGWRAKPAGGPSPVARHSHQLVWDPISERVLLSGGKDASFASLGDVWAWDGTTWSQLPVSGPLGTVHEHVLGNDPLTGEVLLLSGRGAGNTYVTVPHRWTGSAWSPEDWAARPAPTFNQLMAYDPVHEEVVLYGGDPTPSTWIWDGRTWTQVTGLPLTPPFRERAAMAWDPVEEEVILFGGRGNGGYLADTWAWDGTGWLPKLTFDAPSPRWSHSLTGTPDGLRLVGGYDGAGLADEWLWAGGTWTDVTPAPIVVGPLEEHVATYDAARDQLLVGGGLADGYFNKTLFARDALGWSSLVQGGQPPPGRRFGRLTYDPLRERSLLLGGEVEAGNSYDTWMWDGEAWERLEASGGRPGGRTATHAQTFDEANGTYVIFGPSDSDDGETTVLLDSGAAAHPTHHLAVDWTYAGAAGSTVRRIQTRLVAGGTGFPGGSPTHGAELYLWDVDQWRQVATHDAPAASPEALCVVVRAAGAPAADPGCTVIADDRLVRRLAVGLPSKAMRIAVSTAAPSGPGGRVRETAEIATEDAEVAVRYRLPAP
ncbi:MAG: hypothetical protein H6732_20070 [Alphaproteobacteria bacterium]|nr:hypothetical protein [Alphaproteobacteria bacterium]